MKRKYKNSSWYFYVHSGGRDVTAGSSHDFGTYCERGIDWDSICSVLLAYHKKWRIRIIKSSEEKEQSGSGSGAAEEGPDDGNNGQDETYNPVYEWYTRCGRERIKAISTNIFAHGKMNFGFVPMVSVISAPQRVTDGLAIFLDIRAHKPILLPNI